MNEFEFEKKEELTEAHQPEENKEVIPDEEIASEVSASNEAEEAEDIAVTEQVVPENTETAEVPATEEVQVEATTAPVEEKSLWNFAIQAEEDRKKAKKRGATGALVYAIIMTCLFAVCFAVLAVLLITGNNEITDEDHDDDKDEITQRPPAQILDPTNLPDLVDSVKDGVVTVYTNLGFGTGFVYTDDGYIITNFHVIDGVKKITVICTDGRELDAKLIDGDELSDVAVIYVKDLGIPKLAVGNSDLLRVGEEVIAIGTPNDTEYAGTVTKGIISGVKRKVRVYEEEGYLNKTMEMIQTDTTLNHGNSGGPLINMSGEVIGINTMKYYASDAGDTLYFSIPINDAAEIADDIIKNGKYSGDKGSASQGVQLGISGTTAVKGETIRIDQMTSVTPEVDGVLIVAVNEGYAAYGKLEMFDIVVSFDGVPTKTIDGLRAELFKHKVGDTVTLEVWRDGKTVTVDITL